MNRSTVFAIGAAITVIMVIAGGYLYHHRDSYKIALSKMPSEYCEKRSVEIFTAKGWRFDERPITVQFATYRVHHRSHYDARSGKCFFLITQITHDRRDHATRISASLYDVFGREIYAD